MSNVLVDNHDFLGKLSVIKNCLSLLLEKDSGRDEKELLEMAANTNQQLIDNIKAAKNEKDSNC